MRNQPPTPASYAQRSGRAGRSGQPALVVSYCTTLSPHDQYYFRRPTLMVSGAVAPPRLDLANRELIEAHVHAVWLAETGQSLYGSVSQVVDLSDSDLPLRPEVRAHVDAPKYQLTAERRCRRILETLTDELTPTRAPWFKQDWLTATIRNAPLALDRSADRWRHLYRSAREQREQQDRIVADPLRTSEERRTAQNLRAEAEAQIELLTSTRQGVYSDFYSYRYFATEGFLPGYNFPRLPVSAFIPGRRNRKGDEEFLSRPRFIAISEFGPRTIVYHEGSRYRIERVVLPQEDSGRRTTSAVICQMCGYGHFGSRTQVDLCDLCGTRLDGASSWSKENLLRLASVSTRRVDRITSDEEERLRLGYEIRTIFRFAEQDDGSPATREVRFLESDELVATGTYGPATTLWRINLGWTRRANKELHGFMLDMERGRWEKSNLEPDASDDQSDPLGGRVHVERVIPFVEDRRNALLFRPEEPLDRKTLLSLQYALKRGIEASYQLESAELACEPLPTDLKPAHLLLYESAEGGAGVLVRLAEESDALARAARAALEICHYDPDSGADLRRAERAVEDCEAACYDCLLSYHNQRYQELLDRRLLPGLLLRLASARGEIGAGGQTRETQRERLHRLCQSNLESEFLGWLYEQGLRLPDRAQVVLDGGLARPDFVYDGALTCVYVDGAPHRFPERITRDAAQHRALENLGWTVVRVQGVESWLPRVRELPWVFGEPTTDQSL